MTGLRTLVAELLGGMDGPPASTARVRMVAWLRLLVAFPLVVLPAAIGYYATHVHPRDPGTTFGIRTAWTIAHAATLAINLALIWASRPGAPARAHLVRPLAYALIAGDLVANQIGSHAVGVVLGPSPVFVLLMVAAYRVVLDWRLGVFAAIAASLVFAVSAGLEIAAIIPQQPVLPGPPSAIYDDPGTVIPMAAIIVTGIWVMFAAINYAHNQALKLHRYITDAVLRRYLPAGLVERAGRGELRLDDAPEQRVVTVIFTDLVGFTAIAERLGAEMVGRLLTRYFAETAAVAHAHGAIVDKFIGDAAMVVVGAPDTVEPGEQARRAVAIAREIHQRLPGLVADVALQARTGINTGEAVVGNFGSAERSDYTAVGPAVNLAARLEAAAGAGQILVGAETARLLDGAVPLTEVGELTLKGIGSTRAYRLG